jgi:hypothetical protein
MNNIAQMILFILSVIVVLALYRKAKEDESYLFIKIVGFTFLGAIFLDLGDFKLPLGFVVFLLFFRKPKANADTKYSAASFGLVLFLFGIVFGPQVEQMIYERTHHVDLLDTNFYSGSMAKELEHLKDQFDMDDNSVQLRGLDLTIDEDGTYTYLSMGLADWTHEGIVHYSVDLSDDRKSLEVSRNKVSVEDEKYLKDLMFTDARLVLENLDLIDNSMLDFEGKKFYQFRTGGQREIYEVEGDKNYQINTAGKTKVENSQLPVKAIVVEVCGSKEVHEHRYPFKCGPDQYFLLDMLKYEVPLEESTVLEVAGKQSSKVAEWMADHIGDSVGYEKNGDFILVKDGIEEKVQESEYVTALKETPKKTVSLNEQENIWEVTVENPYGDAPHIMEFKLNGETREVTDLSFK